MPIGRAFGDPNLTPDNFSSFSKQEISADTKAKGIEQLEPIPPARSTAPMDLAAVIGAAATQAIENSGKITFHTVGDTGGIHNPEFQFAVADAMANDSGSGACLLVSLGRRRLLLRPGAILFRTVLRSLPRLQCSYLCDSGQSRRSSLHGRKREVVGRLCGELLHQPTFSHSG